MYVHSIHISLRRFEKELYCARQCNLNNISVFSQWTQYGWLITKLNSIGSEVLVAVSVKTTICYDVMPCNLVKVYRRSRGTCFFLPSIKAVRFMKLPDYTASHSRIVFSSNIVELKHDIFHFVFRKSHLKLNHIYRLNAGGIPTAQLRDRGLIFGRSMWNLW